MTAFELGSLKINDNGIVSVAGEEILLSPKLNSIFNRIAQANGEPVPKSAFVEAGEALNIESLKVRVSALRKIFEPHLQAPVFLSTPSKGGFKKENRFDGYALNVSAFGS